MTKKRLKFWDCSFLGLSVAKKIIKKSRQFDLVKLIGVREEDGERRPPAQMVPISKCITTQTKYIRSEISHTSIRKYLHKYKKYTHTNTDQVHSVGNISHKYKKILTQIQEIPTRKYKLSTFGRKYLTQRRQSIFGRKGHKYKPSKFRIRYRIQI